MYRIEAQKDIVVLESDVNNHSKHFLPVRSYLQLVDQDSDRVELILISLPFHYDARVGLDCKGVADRRMQRLGIAERGWWSAGGEVRAGPSAD